MRIKILYSVMLVLLTFQVQGNKKTDSKLYIESDTAKFYQDTLVVSYNENVKVKHGNMHLTANKVDSFFDDKKDLIRSIAYGNQDNQSHYWENSKTDDYKFEVFADKIEYLPKIDTVLFKGNVTIKNSQGTYNATNVKYNINTKQMLSDNQAGNKVVMKLKVS